MFAIQDCPWQDAKGWAVFSVSTVGEKDDVTLTIDINGEETPEQLIARICKEADIKREDIVLAWASPPCETYSRANWSNLSRGFNHRLLEEGFPPAEGAKGVKAAEHDKLTQKVMKVLGLIGRYVM